MKDHATMEGLDPLVEEKLAEMKVLDEAITSGTSDLAKAAQKIRDQEIEPGTPFPLPDLHETPPKKVDKRKNRKLTKEQMEKMRLGRIKAKAKREEAKGPKSPIPESTSPSPPLLKLRKSTSEESPEDQSLPKPTLRILSEPGKEEKPTGPIDIELEAFKVYLDTEFGPAGVEMQLRGAFGGGLAPIPPPPRWAISPNLDISHLVWEQVQTDSFIDEIWPSVKMLLGGDTLNRQWAAGVCTILSLMNIIRVLPIVIESAHDAEREAGE